MGDPDHRSHVVYLLCVLIGLVLFVLAILLGIAPTLW